MVSKDTLSEWVVEALGMLGGSGTVTDVSRTVWELHSEEIQSSGDLFYTWQYDLRWAAYEQRKRGVILPASPGAKRWELAP